MIQNTTASRHGAIQMVQNLLRERSLRSLEQFISAHPDHPKSKRITDPELWRSYFQEMLEALPQDAQSNIALAILDLMSKWDTLSSSRRLDAARAITATIVAERILEHLRNDPEYLSLVVPTARSIN